MTPLEAYDLARFLPGVVEWLNQTASALEPPAHERAWLSSAQALLSEALVGTEVRLAQGRNLPELPGLRAEWVQGRQQSFVDALEALHAQVSQHAGTRSPLLETLFPPVKLPALRKARPEAVRDFSAELRRRAQSAYAIRQLQEPGHAPLAAALADAQGRSGEWQSADSAPALEGEAAESARQTLALLGETLSRRWQQARLLIEASLLGTPGGPERLRELPRPKRRTSRAGATDAPSAPDAAAAAPTPEP